jgi:hypothetical protein
MAFNGSGTYNLPAGNPVVTGTTISSSTTNTTNSDIATALTNCITRDGQSTPSANLPMNAKKLTGLAAGTSAGDSVRYEQVLLLAGGTMTGAITFAAGQTFTGTLPLTGGTMTGAITFAAGQTFTGTLPLTGGTMTGNLTLDAYTEKVATLATSGTIALNPSTGTTLSCAAAGTVTFTDSLSSGQSISLLLTNGSSYTINWPTTTWVTAAGNTAPTLSASNTLVFWKISSTLYGALVGKSA